MRQELQQKLVLCEAVMLSSAYYIYKYSYITYIVQQIPLVSYVLATYSFRSSTILQTACLGWMCTMMADRETVLGQSV